jgi:uncharacterized protein (TIGR02646 family)
VIELQRNRANTDIPSSFRGNKHIANSLLLLKGRKKHLQNTDEKQEFTTSKWKPAKESLLKDTHNKCAYCEASIKSTGYGDVEHYRPKSVYWWLAYSFENYLVSCAMCNQAFKSNKFPRRTGGSKMRGPRVRKNTSANKLAQLSQTAAPNPQDIPVLAAYKNAHFDEKPGLLNPYMEDPELVFAWEVDFDDEYIHLVPILGDLRSKHLVGFANTVYGFDRHQLKRDRFFAYRFYRLAKMTFLEPTASQGLRDFAEEELLRMQQDDFPFAGMLRFFARQDGLPTV